MVEKQILKKLSKITVLLVTHSRATGISQILKDWLVDKAETLIFIEHPLYPTSKLNSSAAIYKKDILEKTFSSPFIFKSGILLYIKDAFFTIYFVIKSKKTIDIAIGVDNLNTIILLILKKINRIKKVVYHTVDYTPDRFSNKVLNFIYHSIDRFCCYNSDIIWNSSGRMNEGRVKNGADKSKIVKTIITPDGSNFDPEKRLPISEINRKMVVFLGHLRERMGLELLIEAFKEVAEKIQDAKLMIIGDGPLFGKLQGLVNKLKISKSVIFTGFIENHVDVDEELRKAALGVATFEPVKDSYEYYSDAGKPKVYLAAGLPVIITKVPEIAWEIEKNNAGVIVAYSRKSIANAILRLLGDDKLYQVFRNNAILLSKKYIWNNIFFDAFSKTLDYFYKN